MATIITRTREMRQQLATGNEARRLNSADHRTESNRINKKIKKVRRDYQLKNSRSVISASRLVLTA